MYRILELYSQLEYNMAISQMVTMLARNYTYVFYMTHIAACLFFQIARIEGFATEGSWVGRAAARFQDQPPMIAYMYSLYFSISAFAGLGDASFYESSAYESLFLIIYLLINLVMGAYILGSVTLLVVRTDKRSKVYRDRMTNFADFASSNDIPQALGSSVRQHLDLHFHGEQVSDTSVLSIFPTTIKRKVMRHTYMRTVKNCYLFAHCKQKFFDAFIKAAHVELFMPGVRILSPGDPCRELFIIVSGTARGMESDGDPMPIGEGVEEGDSLSSPARPDDELGQSCPFGEVAFFTDLPCFRVIRSSTVLRVLVLTKAAFEVLSSTQPQQTRIMLDNLQGWASTALNKSMKGVILAHGGPSCTPADIVALFKRKKAAVRRQLSSGSIGSLDDTEDERSSMDSALGSEPGLQVPAAKLERLQFLESMRLAINSHILKTDQARTLTFLRAASFGRREQLMTLLSQGVSPNTADYDKRTALMMACAAGHTAVVKVLLDMGADHTLKDSLGHTAMCEAVRNNHARVMDAMLARGARLGLDDTTAASQMCACVVEGDLQMLRRLLKAGAPPDAADYDGRCALHLSAAEGNLAAVRVLVEEGRATVAFRDRWGSSPLDEARRAGAAAVVAYLERRMTGPEVALSLTEHRQAQTGSLVTACGAGDVRCVQRLLREGGGGASGCAVGLLLAAAHQHTAVVQLLLSWMGPEELRCSLGVSALIDAAKDGRGDLVELLAGMAGARQQMAQDACARRALFAAIREHNHPCVSRLLSGGADADASDEAGSHPAHTAVASANLPALRLLFERGEADLRSLDGSGSTALQLARNSQRSGAGSPTGSSISIRVGSRCPSPVREYLEWLQEAMDRVHTCGEDDRTEASSVSAFDRRGDGSVDGGPAAGGLAAAAAARFGPVSLDAVQRAAVPGAPGPVAAAAAAAAAAGSPSVGARGRPGGDDGVRVCGSVNAGDAALGSSDGGGGSDGCGGGAGGRIGRVEEWARLAGSGDHSMSAATPVPLAVTASPSLVMFLSRGSESQLSSWATRPDLGAGVSARRSSGTGTSLQRHRPDRMASFQETVDWAGPDLDASASSPRQLAGLRASSSPSPSLSFPDRRPGPGIGARLLTPPAVAALRMEALREGVHYLIRDSRSALTEAQQPGQEQSLDFSLLTDGLDAEREQGITIDVAYRYFQTPRRSFIVADCPGHEQYTRNMATGASNAELAIVLVDARKGLLTQTRRHTYICGLLGIRQIVVAVNKMDLVDYDPAIYETIVTEYRELARDLGIESVKCIPVVAPTGENVGVRSKRMDWYQGPCLLELLEGADTITAAAAVEGAAVNANFRMPVACGDEVIVQPGIQRARIQRIVTADGDLPSASTGQAVTLCFDREVDASRGDVISSALRPAPVADQFNCHLLWLGDAVLLPSRTYLLKIGTRRQPRRHSRTRG
ncbi:MAG: hypothetical protein WDW36_007064 [Sanguina aurantia]